MDCPVWWDEKMATAVHRTECTLDTKVVRYAVKQYFHKIENIAYLKIVTCIIEMMYCWLCIMCCIISS
jgi:hypothetical protein